MTSRVFEETVTPIIEIDPVEPLIAATTVIKDIVIASTTVDELRCNDLAATTALQIETLLPALYKVIESLDEGELTPLNSEGHQYGIGDLLKLSDVSERFLKLWDELCRGTVDNIEVLKTIANARYDDNTGSFVESGGCVLM